MQQPIKSVPPPRTQPAADASSAVAGNSAVAYRRVLAMTLLMLSAIAVTDLLALSVGEPLLGLAAPLTTLLLLATCTTCGLLLLLVDRDLLWTPAFWMLTMCALFHGVGPLAYYIVDDAAIAQMDKFWPVGPYEIVRTNLLNVVGIGCVLVGLMAVGVPRQAGAERNQNRIGAPHHAMFGIGLWVVGFLVYDLVLQPEVASGRYVGAAWLLMLTGYLTVAGIVVIGAAAARDGKWVPALLFATASSVAIAALAADKSSAIMALGAATAGLFLGSGRIRYLAVGAMLAIPLYLVLAYTTAAVRYALGVRTGDASVGTASERIDAFSDSLSRRIPTDQTAYSALCRLSYINTAAMTMEWHERGFSADSLNDLQWVVVPRILYPDKPLIGEVGNDFYRLAGGAARSSALGLGYFAEAYWNGGWWYVVAFGGCLGVAFGLIGRVHLAIIRDGPAVFLPLVLIGIVTGFEVDGWIVLSLANTTVYWVAGMLAWIVVRSLLRPRHQNSVHG